jgi:hypothetical protein
MRARIIGVAAGSVAALAVGVATGANVRSPERTNPAAHTHATREAARLDDPLLDATTTPARAPLVYRLTNDLDLEAALTQASRDVIGRNHYAADGPAFVAEYHGSERSYQFAVYEARTATSPASPYVAAAAFMRREHPDDAQAYAELKVSQEFYKIISGPSPTTACYGCASTTTTSTTRPYFYGTTSTTSRYGSYP